MGNQGHSSDEIRSLKEWIDDGAIGKVNEIYAETFNKTVSPARACVEVSKLPKGGKIEIDCIAWLENKK